MVVVDRCRSQTSGAVSRGQSSPSKCSGHTGVAASRLIHRSIRRSSAPSACTQRRESAVFRRRAACDPVGCCASAFPSSAQLARRDLRKRYRRGEAALGATGRVIWPSRGLWHAEASLPGSADGAIRYMRSYCCVARIRPDQRD